MLLVMPVSLPLPLSTSLAWPLPLSLLLEDFTLELDVMSPTLLELSMSPRGRLRLMLSTELDMLWDMLVWDMLVWDMLVWDMLVLDMLVWDTLVLDTVFWDTMLLAMPVYLPPPPLASLAWPLLLSLPSEEHTLELDVMSLTLLVSSMP